MKLNEEHCEAFFSHFPQPDSLTPQELVAVLALTENGIDYFMNDYHAVTEEFGTAEDYRAGQSSAQYSGELLLKAS